MNCRKRRRVIWKKNLNKDILSIVIGKILDQKLPESEKSTQIIVS